jgi:CHASE2 domain-containing sensor protein/signal transduction histidine kinase
MAGAPARLTLRRQWLALLLILGGAMSAIIATDAFWRPNNILYDLSVPRGPVPPDILIVAIDDASVAELGRWPWRRATLALGLEQLAKLQPQAVVLDVLLLEPDRTTPEDDRLLAATIANGPPTVMPLSLELDPRAGGLREVLPVEPLRTAAARLGHVHLEIDRDGIARSVFLREGLAEARWSHLALAALEALNETPRGGLRGTRHPQPDRRSAVWQRDYRVRIPFLGPPGYIRTVSFADIVRGSVEPASVRDRIVLVGATAQGLGDAYPTSRSGESRAMAGVEITANTLAMLRSGVLLRDVPAVWQHAIGWGLLVALFIGFLRLSPRASLLLVAALMVVVVFASAALLRGAYWWFAPVPLLAAIASAYPLWSWRRLEATQGFLQEELAVVAREPDPISALAPMDPASSAERFGDVVEHRIELARQATARLRTMRHFLWATIANLPDATLAIRADGRVALANTRAAELLGAKDVEALQGVDAEAALRPLLAQAGETFAGLQARAPCTFEIRAVTGQDLLIAVSRFRDETTERDGTIFEIANVSSLKRALRERQDLMRFLSHDMRSPASSLVALARLQQEPARALDPAEFARQAETLASRSLVLTDGFLALARAEAASTRDFEVLDFCDVAHDARDEVWAAVRAKHIQLTASIPNDSLWVHGSRELLTRAIVNLLANAVKYTQVQGVVELHVEADGSKEIALRVRDNGPGIAIDKQSGLFVAFQRAVSPGPADPGGLGLGLAFVKLVAEKHAGRTQIHSVPGEGATFWVYLPRAAAPSDADR